MSAKSLSKKLICPICHEHKAWGEMVKHIAYAGDSEHKQWRISHGFKANIDFGSHNKYEPTLRVAVVREFSNEGNGRI